MLHPVPLSRPLVAPASCCIASQCTALSSSRSLVVPPLVVSSCQLIVAPSSLVILSLHCPLVLSSCWLVVALPLIAPPSLPLIVVHCRCHRTPRNAPPPLNAISIVHRCHSCRPSSPSNANTHLRPLLRCLSTRCPLVVLLSRRAATPCLVAPAGCRIIISRRPLVALPSSCPLVLGTTTGGTATARGSRATGGTTMATGGTTTARGSRATGGTTTATGSMAAARGSRATGGTTTAMSSTLMARGSRVGQVAR